MEALPGLDARPYDPRFPVVCFDERPCFLLGHVVEGLAPQPAQAGKKGQPAKEHYAQVRQLLRMAARHQLHEPDLSRLASPWAARRK